MEPSAAERLAALRERLKNGRGENLKAVEQESRNAVPVRAKTDEVSRSDVRRSLKKRKRSSLGSDDEEDDDPIEKSIIARAAQISRAGPSASESLPTVPAVYGGSSGGVSAEHSDRLVEDLKETEERRTRFRRRRAFVAENADISFISEGNKNFNRILGKHYDRFESVKKIKDSLERGTALP